MSAPTTVSVFKARVGSYPGLTMVPQEIIAAARTKLTSYMEQNLFRDFRVFGFGSNLCVIIAHDSGPGAKNIIDIMWLVIETCADMGIRMKLHGVGEDIFPDTGAEHERPGRPEGTELSFSERRCNPFILFASDRVTPGSFNLPLLRIFGDPLGNPALSVDRTMSAGFSFEVVDLASSRTQVFETPRDLNRLIAYLGSGGRSERIITAVSHVDSRGQFLDGELIASASTPLIHWKDGAIPASGGLAIVRAEEGLPATGDILAPFSIPRVVQGFWERHGSAPLTPMVSTAPPSTLGSFAVVAALGFNLSGGKLIGPCDMFSGPEWTEVRSHFTRVAMYLHSNLLS
ncbi:MAG: hypothetical protein CVV64_18020 [Candidatus Wallbacteria bacterium HGW-Wallbacteria-1]|uniref:Fructose-1,6-bisphosphate aldolase/phosphatase n=1 Tax=Candidatus Wallbacteria bacterium HGW-Wallbacteria-1 TaxID=2013854 RepID=A0A2N1PJY7_9BACT|nr:MAG: hypothetical protein CVV64_18020 [Candidatus Wallbacteria bacterium HGW-Wallbacteria-1]